MHSEDISRWVHDHLFHVSDEAAERSTRRVMWITAVTMVIEITAGWWFNSMALLADGWHMSSHAVAIGLSALAYATARRYARDERFAFGTWKIEILAGFASAVFLLGVAAWMVISSFEHLFFPEAIHYPEAIAVAVLGLLANLGCALILGQAHGHSHHHHHASADHAHHDHDHAAHHGHHHHHDLTLKSAYLHVLADAATSVLAIVALVGGWWYGWSWLDPLMGVLGGILVAWWAKGLMAETSCVLLDREMDHPVVDEIREVVEADGGQTRVTDLHVWRVGKQVYACAMPVVTRDDTLTPDQLRQRLAVHDEVVHTTIEIHHAAPG